MIRNLTEGVHTLGPDLGHPVIRVQISGPETVPGGGVCSQMSDPVQELALGRGM